MKVLVTGGAGFVGSVLCRDLLDKGYYVRCVDNFHKGHCDSAIELTPNQNFEFVYGDVADRDVVKEVWKGMDACIHLAAIVGFPQCNAQKSLSKIVNTQGTKNVLDYRNGRTVVYPSTGSVYGAVEGLCTEDTPSNTNTLYGITKKEAEELVTNAGDGTVSLRFATGFGVSPNMRVNLLVNDLTYQAVTQGCLNIFQADFRRTFIHVKDMSRAFIFCLKNINRLNYKVYNCGANTLNWTKRELATYISEKTGAVVSFNEVGEDLDKRDYEVSYDRLMREGFACEISMEEGIDELIKVSKVLRITHQYE